MKKHSTGMRNLELMKWCTYYDINNLYNILVGFAGETTEDYRLQCEVIAKIPHFQPPYAIARARADRGSPMFTEPERHGIGRLRPSDYYRYLFPAGRFDLNKISYYFDHDGWGLLPEREYDEIFRAVGRWQDRWRRGERPQLHYRKSCSSAKFDGDEWVDAALADFCEEDLMVKLDDQYLSLALPKNAHV